MSEVYRRVNGKKLTKLIAEHEVVQFRLGQVTGELAARASSILAAHRHDGHARIETERGRIDHYVVLDDTRGLGAAMSIEFGREGSELRAGMQGVAPLRRAASLPVRSVRTAKKPSGRLTGGDD